MGTIAGIHPSKPDMKGRTPTTTLAVAGLVAALLTGCASKAQPGSEGSLGSTVHVGYSDVGRTVHLVVGDTLIVNLSRTGSQLKWRLSRYPKDVLRPVNAGIAPGMFRFEVTAKGTGQLLIIDSFPCAGGPASGAMKACPYAAGAAGSSPEAGANLAIRPFSVTVQVT